MASIKKKTETKNTLQQAIEEERSKIPSKYEFNKVLFSWEANDRPEYSFTGLQKSSFTGLVILFGLYFYWIGQPVLVLILVAVLFILLVLVNIPPQRVKHSIESVGIRSQDRLYEWSDMHNFWMAEKSGAIMLYIDTRLRFPSRLIFIIESYEEALIVANNLIKVMEYRTLGERQTRMEIALEGEYINPMLFFGKTPDGVPLAELKKTK
jgi:hypothetical protein